MGAANDTKVSPLKSLQNEEVLDAQLLTAEWRTEKWVLQSDGSGIATYGEL
jgi:hypothetical protein